MYPTTTTQDTQVVDETNTYTTMPLTFVIQPDIRLYVLLLDLFDDTDWGTRKDAAQKLGTYRNPAALHGLLEALPNDPFWMVRCAIIQALEMIGDRLAIPTLRAVAKNDTFQVVRSYAAKAIERLS